MNKFHRTYTMNIQNLVIMTVENLMNCKKYEHRIKICALSLNDFQIDKNPILENGFLGFQISFRNGSVLGTNIWISIFR